MFDIWSEKLNAGGVLKEYTLDNYRVVNTNSTSKSCLICCSSNDLWYPNTKEVYEEFIVKNDRYEWESFDLIQFKKIIYIRDLYKSWYVTGINTGIDCIDKLIEIIAEETQGYNIVCAGSSAGGYLAIILGCKLYAQYILAFSPQVELNNKWCAGWNRFLQHYKNDPERNKYYNITSIIENGKTPIYYILPVHSEQDQYQYSFVNDIPNVKVFCFNSNHHGVVMLNSCLRKFMVLSQDEIEMLYQKYKGKNIGKWGFSLKVAGIAETFKEFYKKVRKRIGRIIGA